MSIPSRVPDPCPDSPPSRCWRSRPSSASSRAASANRSGCWPGSPSGSSSRGSPWPRRGRFRAAARRCSRSAGSLGCSSSPSPRSPGRRCSRRRTATPSASRSTSGCCWRDGVAAPAGDRAARGARARRRHLPRRRRGAVGAPGPWLVTLDRSISAGGRLEQPLGYWNAMGALAAIGLVLCAGVAGDPDARGGSARGGGRGAAAGYRYRALVLPRRAAVRGRGPGGARARRPTRGQLASAAVAVVGAALAGALAASLGGVTTRRAPRTARAGSCSR